MRRVIMIATAVSALTIPASALALTPGGTDYSSLKDNPAPNAQCGTGAGSGAFGAFGTYSEFGSQDFAGGANGYQTGLNNSAVCGHRS